MLCLCADVRSNGPAPRAGQPAKIAPERHCLECGDPFANADYRAEYCGTACRRAFNHRRAARGAEIYDLLMAFRFDRATATILRVFTLLCRLAAIYRQEDRTERAGRRSWRHPAEIIERRPYLKADVLRQGRKES